MNVCIILFQDACKFLFMFSLGIFYYDISYLYDIRLPICLQAFFSANAAAQASRKSSPRVTNEAVQKAVSL